jgi:hypothetical protein
MAFRSQRNAEASAAWRRDEMGFDEYARVSGDDWFGTVLLQSLTSSWEPMEDD